MYSWQERFSHKQQSQDTPKCPRNCAQETIQPAMQGRISYHITTSSIFAVLNTKIHQRSQMLANKFRQISISAHGFTLLRWKGKSVAFANLVNGIVFSVCCLEMFNASLAAPDQEESNI